MPADAKKIAIYHCLGVRDIVDIFCVASNAEEKLMETTVDNVLVKYPGKIDRTNCGRGLPSLCKQRRRDVALT